MPSDVACGLWNGKGYARGGDGRTRYPAWLKNPDG